MKVSLAGVLTTIFVVLKLIGIISWQWVWVLSPLWITFTLFGFLTALIIAIEEYEEGV